MHKSMKRLADAYRANPTIANAIKVRTHNIGYPMAVSVLSAEDGNLVTAAIAHANTSKSEAA